MIFRVADPEHLMRASLHEHCRHVATALRNKQMREKIKHLGAFLCG